MRRVLFFGNREWTCRKTIMRVMQELQAEHGPCLLIHGGNGKVNTVGRVLCGADLVAAECAARLDWQAMAFPVPEEEWRRIGDGAGPLRNLRMLEVGQPNEGFGFGRLTREERAGALQWTNRSFTGTHDMLMRLNAAGIPVHLIARPA